MNIQSVKKNWLWIALVCTLGATAWTALNDSNTTEKLPMPATHSLGRDYIAAQVSVGQQHRLPFTAVQRAKMMSEPQDLFDDSQTIQEQALVHAAVAAVPQMPALPFTYAGKLFDDGRYMVFVIQGDRNLALTIGNVIDKVWRVKNIDPPKMTLSYLPLRMDAVLDIGESN